MSRLWVFWIALFLMPVTSQADDQQALWEALQDGGKVILMRHATVDSDIGDSFIRDESCFTEKNLNELGERQVKAINSAFKQRAIRIDKVWASPYCRTKDTAKLAFGKFEVSPLLKLIRAVPEQVGKEHQAQIRKILSSYQQEANMVMVTHRPNIADITNIRLEPAQMIVFEPLGDGLFDVLGVLEVPIANHDEQALPLSQ